MTWQKDRQNDRHLDIMTTYALWATAIKITSLEIPCLTDKVKEVLVNHFSCKEALLLLWLLRWVSCNMKLLWNTLTIFLKLSSNIFETFSKPHWNFQETILKYPWHPLETQLKLVERPLKLPWITVSQAQYGNLLMFFLIPLVWHFCLFSLFWG